jgi:AcrR family transcriptional regulator
MPRPKTLPDRNVLDVAYRLMHRHGPDSLTFASLAKACGLSASTLVQRFKGKAELLRSTLLYAWDLLDEKTATVSAKVPRTPAGAIAFLTALSKDYGDIEAYADALLILREDLRDPALRARGAKWKAVLSRILDECFAAAPRAPRGIGLLMAAQWQGSLLWWSFEPQGRVEDFVESNLKRFVSALAPSGPVNPSARARSPKKSGRK